MWSSTTLGQAGQLPVHQHDRSLPGDLLEVLVREPAGGQHEPVHRRDQPLDLVVLDARRLLRVDEHEGVLRGLGAHLRAADQLEVVRVGDVGDHHRDRVVAAGQQGAGVRVRPVPELGGHGQDVLTGARVDPVRGGEARETVEVATPAAGRRRRSSDRARTQANRFWQLMATPCHRLSRAPYVRLL